MRRLGIHIEHLSLTNFRNYQELGLDLRPGLSVFRGGNGQGKSNLLEAIYVLAIAKSPHASSDREMVRWQSAKEGGHAQIVAIVRRDRESLKIQVDIQCLPVPSGELQQNGGQSSLENSTVQKRIRVSGLPRLASELVGEVNVVMFSAQDIQMVHGSPWVRRKYLDVLLSQLDHVYLRSLQKYQKVLYQRNYLLRSIREGRAQEDELDFWDNELVAEGEYIVNRRYQAIQALSGEARTLNSELTGSAEVLDVIYKPSVGEKEMNETERIAVAFQRALDAQRKREVNQGMTLSGPHRDDIQLSIDGIDAGLYASRGQARTVALSMKLAEAAYLAQQRGLEPILLLDDVLSELDAARRSHVLSKASQFQQCLVTTTDMELIEGAVPFSAYRFVVYHGRVDPLSAGGAPEKTFTDFKPDAGA